MKALLKTYFVRNFLIMVVFYLFFMLMLKPFNWVLSFDMKSSIAIILSLFATLGAELLQLHFAILNILKKKDQVVIVEIEERPKGERGPVDTTPPPSQKIKEGHDPQDFIDGQHY